MASVTLRQRFPVNSVHYLDLAIIAHHQEYRGDDHWSHSGVTFVDRVSGPVLCADGRSGLHEIDHGVIEAAEAMGANKTQIILKVLLPESMPALVSEATVTTISLIGYTAMAGAIGAGGLGNLAYIDGFETNNNTIVLVATVIIVLIVFVFQFIGDFLVRRIDKRTL